MKDQTAVAGIGTTEFAKSLEDTERVLALKALQAALDDAGIEPHEVDGLSCYSMEATEEIDQKVDADHLEEVLMTEGVEKFADPQKALLDLIEQRRKELATI